MHDFINHYRDDTRVHVDLLPADLEPSFSEQNYGTIHGAPSQARLNGDAGDKSGAYRTYSFAFGCEQLGALQATLGAVADGSRQAAFRYDADTTAAESLFSMETGFNRRSAGIEYRPRLVLFLDDGRGGAIDPLLCDPSLPAPSISDVGVTPVSSGVTSVSWRTNVPSDSTVLFRARGSAGAWTQVANPARATVHAVSVAVPDASAGYEFAVRSATCGGATTTDDRSGTGYTFAPQRPTAPAAVPTVTNWFNGAPPAATFSPSPPSDASTETQTALVIGDDTTPGASDVAAWSGPQSGEIRRIDFDWWWSTDNPLQVALGPEVAVSVFTSATPTGPWTRIGGGSVPIAVDVGTPVRSQGGFPLSGTSQGHLLFQVSGRYVDTSQTQTVHYGSTATPSSFAISTAAPLAGPGVPTAIPFPPVPAGSSGLDAGSVATRTDPNAGDLRAGTARCASLFASAAAGGIGSRLPGYRMVAGDGGIFTFGARTFHGSTGDLKLRAPIVGGATDVSDDDGYWIVASDGGVFTFGTEFHGSLGDRRLPSPAVEIEPTPTGKGYWVVLANGKVFTFGDANHFGDMEGRPLNKPMIGMSVTPSGRGYWLVAEDGGIFNFGDAGFFGSTGDKRLNAPIIDLAPSTDNAGYYLLGKDGGVFTFGSADFKGSTGSLKLNAPVVAMLVSHDGSGYWLGASDGGVFTFGAVPFLGSMGDVRLNSPVLDLIH
jgi:hypothetical protein